MEIINQFEVMISSFFFGIFFMITFDFFNRMFYKKKGKLIRLIFETLLFLLLTLLFFIIVLNTYNGNFNIFIPMFIMLGIIIYMYFLQYNFQYAFNDTILKISKKIKQKRLYLSSKFDIIKMKRRKARINKYEKNQKSKKSHKQ